MSRIGEKVKEARINSGMTQKALGKKLGVSEGFIKEVESGTKVINQTLVDRISKVLKSDINDITLSFEENVFDDEPVKNVKYSPAKEVNEVWGEAFGSVIKNVPVYDYGMTRALEFKKLPIINNKIEGFAQDKVFYILIENDDMIGFRIAKGDIAFAHIAYEVENNSTYLMEYGEKRVVRQVKKLDNSKVLLMSNRGSLRTETAEIKSIKVIAKLERLEINL